MPKKILSGIVLKKKEKSCVVSVTREKTHSLYKKRYMVHKKYHVHDSAGAGEVGAQVRIKEHAAFSKSKRWLLLGGEEA